MLVSVLPWGRLVFQSATCSDCNNAVAHLGRMEPLNFCMPAAAAVGAAVAEVGCLSSLYWGDLASGLDFLDYLDCLVPTPLCLVLTVRRG